MAKGYYDPVLSKTDPLVSLHVKLPRSTVAVLNAAARKRQRPATFLMREAIVAWQRDYMAKATDEEVAEFENDRGGPVKKKRKAS